MGIFTKEVKTNYGVITEPRVFNITLAVVWGLMVLFFSGFYVVEPWQVAIEKRFGEITDDVKDEGLHFKIPLVDKAVKMDIRNRKIEGNSDSASKDLQIVNSVIAVNYSITKDRVINLYQSVGRESDIDIVLVKPAIEESVKSATAKFNASELITKREDVSASIVANLKAKLETRGLLINEINIVDFQFSPEFDKAIEAKVKAEQDALKAEKDLERVKFEAQQKIERAKAEAEQIRIQAEAINKQGWAEYVKLKWIEAWQAGGSNVPTTILWGESEYILNLK